MKSLKILLLLAMVISCTLTAVLEDYVQGMIDEDGDNLWHILAQGCDQLYFKIYLEELATVDLTRADEELLASLSCGRNNINQSPLDIAAEKWSQREHVHCADMIKMICAWKKMDEKGFRSKKINPFSLSLKIDGEDKTNGGN